VNSLLIEQLIDGDEAAFKELYDIYKEKVYRTAWMLTNNASTSQDIIQEVFIQVYLKIHKLKYLDAFESWLYKITVNCSLKHMKKNKELTVVFDENILTQIIETNISCIPEDKTLQIEFTKELLSLVYSLPKEKKTTIILYFYNNMSIKKIAEVMNCSEGTVKSRLFNSKKILEKKINKSKKYNLEENVYGY